MNDFRHQISIIIINYNAKQYLKNCLRSIYDTTKDIDYEIIVVDNASNDGSVEMLQREFPNIKLVINNENIGFAKANNIGIQESTGNYVLLLNPDTIVMSESIYKMYNFLAEHIDVGMVGPKILNSNGTIQYECARNFPTPFTEFTILTTLYKHFPKNRFFGYYLMTYWKHDEIKEVNAISGACMMIKRNVLDKIGLFDEKFFMYGEDTDLCYRVKKNGWKIYFLPTAQIIHLWGKSTDQVPYIMAAEARKSIELFFRKHYGLKAVVVHRLIAIFASIFIQLIISLIYLFYPQKNRLKNIFLRNHYIFKWAIGL